ncbi:hypothetical protein GINT2_000377 [Glugoides intestinalis]
MLLQLEKICDPTGINDVKDIKIHGKAHFAVSFGCQMRFYDGDFEVHRFDTHFDIHCILSYQDCYFLIGKERYMVYKGFKKLAEHTFGRNVQRIQNILSLGPFLIIFHVTQRYSIGKIKNLEIDFDSSLSDSQFFDVLNAKKVGDSVIILAKTFYKRFIITYTVENSLLKSTKKEIQFGNIMVKHSKDTILLFDNTGMWEYTEKLVFIKEFANHKILESAHDGLNDRTFLVCMDGELICVYSDNRHVTLGYIGCSSNKMALIHDLIFCGSRCCFSILKITDTLVFLTKKLCSSLNREEQTLINKIKERKKEKLLSRNESFPLHENQPLKKAKTIEGADFLPTSKEIQAFNLPFFKGFLKSVHFTLFNFEASSMINNCKFERVVNANHSAISTEKRFIVFKDDTITQFQLKSSHTKFYKTVAILYKNSEIFIIDLELLKIKTIRVSFDLCDFQLNGENIFCVDFEEKLHIISLEACSPVVIEFSIHSYRNLFCENYTKTNESDLSTHTSLYDFGVNCGSIFLKMPQKVLTVINTQLKVIFVSKHFIENITSYNDILIISSSNTVVYDIIRKKTFYLDFDTTNSFIFQSNPYLCFPNGTIKGFNVENLESFPNLHGYKYELKNCLISVENHIDAKYIRYLYRKHKIEFEGFLQTFFHVIRDDLLCIGLGSIDLKKNKIIILKIEDGRLKIRKTIETPSMPLCASSYKNRLCVVTSENIMLLSLRNGKTKIETNLENKSNVFKDVRFYNNNTVLISTHDWFYLVVNLKMKKIKKEATEGIPIPFILKGTSGYAIGNMLHYGEAVIDCVEDVSYIISAARKLLILTATGSVLYLIANPNEEDNYFYDKSHKIINMIV